MRLKDEYYHDDKLTLFQVKTILDEFIINLDRDFYLEQIELVERILKKKFIKKDEQLLDELENETKSFFSFDTFKNNDSTQEIIMAIKEEMNCQHRPKSIAIEGPSKLGKTEFIISYLNHQQLPFNYIRSALNFNKNSYNDKFKIDVYDDISIPEIRRAGLLKILSVVNEDLLLMLNIFLKENYPAINYQYFYVMKILASLFGVLLMLLIMVMNINI